MFQSVLDFVCGIFMAMVDLIPGGKAGLIGLLAIFGLSGCNGASWGGSGDYHGPIGIEVGADTSFYIRTSGTVNMDAEAEGETEAAVEPEPAPDG